MNNASEPQTTERPISASPMRSSLTRRALVAGVTGTLTATVLGLGSAEAKSKEDALIERYIAKMPLRDRIAQMFMFQAYGTDMTSYFDSLLTGVKPGGIIFVYPNISTTARIQTFVKAIHDSNTVVRPWISIDQEGGDVIRLQGDPAPGAIDLGKLSDVDVREKSKERSAFLASFGFDVNFAPVADVAYNASSTMYLRSFGSDPNVVAEKVHAVVRGARSRHIMGAAKHFPGHGRTTVDSHVAIPTVDLSYKTWLKSDALPFQAAVHAGVEMVMVGHLLYSKWDDKPMSLSKKAVRILRDELGFEGIIVTDDLGMGALAGMDPLQVLDRASEAGVDLFLYTMPPLPWDTLVGHLEKRVRDGDVSEKRIDASVRRIVRSKIDHFGLTGKGLPK